MATVKTAAQYFCFSPAAVTIEGFYAKRAYTAFWVDFHFLQDEGNFWQTGLFDNY